MKFSILKFLDKRKFLIMFTLVIVALGHLSGVIVYNKSEMDQKHRLMDIATMAASSVNQSELIQLDGSAKDVQNPYYQELKKQFVNMGIKAKNTGVELIYSVLPKNNEIIFSFDSSEPGTSGFWQPDMENSIYLKPPKALLDSIHTKRATVSNHYSDEYGTYVSAFVPITDSKTGKLLAVIGTDMKYSTYLEKVNSSLIYPLLTVILAVVLLFLVYTDFERLKNSKEKISSSLDKVQHEKAKLETLLSLAGEPIFACNKQGQLTFVNKAAEKALQCRSEEIIGKPIFEVVSEAKDGVCNVAAFHDLVDRLMNKKEKVTLSSLDSGADLICNLNGRVIPVIFSLSPVVINGEIRAIIGVFNDISHIVEVDRMKSDFISLASHQLRTPLAKLHWMIEMLIDDKSAKTSPTQQAMMQNIYNTNSELVKMVGELLDISRFESGRISVKPESTDLGQLAKTVFKTMEYFYLEKGQKIKIEIKENLPCVNVDSKLIGEVYRNLLNNAIKYTPRDGQITLKITPGEKEIISEIIDTGCGIPEEAKSKIFQRFFRADNAKKLSPNGTGLGLYLVKAIIEANHGKIWFESKENEGTNFFFTLPLSQNDSSTAS